MAEDHNRLSRRDVLRGVGAAAFIGSVAPALAAGEKTRDGIRKCGPGAADIELTINGEPRRLTIEPRVTLLDALRDHVGLTGTKRVCDRGACGACTVWLDGRVCNSCMHLAIDAQGASIRTIEGLARGDQLHPIQAAFVREDALQCGFCTPGMIMSCAALYERKQQPTLEEVKHAISGNLCRCGTYSHIFRACTGAGR
jgi:aerobic-type carbon monoxide dehydrogenase small subunit (CoxS/CutS family)